ncbi:MAG TPA: hypothetical protein VKR61_09650 [Bryobacteraceae bacterium]|nr:hypothetical protein [Bryobacteraceae bacterium]
MAVLAPALSPDFLPASNNDPCVADLLLDIVERAMHASLSEWLFFRELRVGTARRNGNVQRLDALALNSFPHTGMKRVCYEVKISRADFRAELKHPLKRRIGMRYSNEFYFVTPAGLVDVAEIPADCGLVEAGIGTADEWKRLIRRQAGFFSFDPDTRHYCIITVPAPWRDTPGPTWQLVAAMLRHQRRELEDRPPKPPAQQRLTFAGSLQATERM